MDVKRELLECAGFTVMLLALLYVSCLVAYVNM